MSYKAIMVEKFKTLIDILMQNKLLLYAGVAIYIALVIKEYSKITMKIKTLEIELEEANDEKINAISKIQQDCAKRGLGLKSSPYIQGKNEAEKKYKQKVEKIKYKINYYKTLLYVAWIPFISGLVSGNDKE